MPIERSHSLDDVVDAACEHAELTGLAPMWAVTLLSGVNDGVAHAHALADLVATFRDRTGTSPRLSVIPYNSIGPADGGTADPFTRATTTRGALPRRRSVTAACSRTSGTAGVGRRRRLRPARGSR